MSAFAKVTVRNRSITVCFSGMMSGGSGCRIIFSLLGVDRILCDSNLIVSKTKALSLICNANIRESAFL